MNRRMWWCVLLAGLCLPDGGLFRTVQAEDRPITLPGCVQFELQSAQGESYRIYLSVPSGPAPASGDPVIYMTDGDSNFSLMYSAVQCQHSPRAIIVAVGYPEEDMAVRRERRTYDLTPPTSEKFRQAQAGRAPTSRTGGQAAFLAFLVDVVKPEVERRCQVDPQRQVLFGHSFGGLFVLHALFTRPEAFNVFVAASPSIWWNDCSVLEEATAFEARAAKLTAPVQVLLNAGEREAPGFGESPQRAQVLASRKQVEHAQSLAQRLNAWNNPCLSAEFECFAREDHGSTLLPACNRAVQAVLNRAR